MMVGVAALAGEVTNTALSNPIPWKDKRWLIDAYGKWAVELLRDAVHMEM